MSIANQGKSKMEREMDAAIRMLGGEGEPVAEPSFTGGSTASQGPESGIAPQVKIYRKTTLGQAVGRAMDKLDLPERLKEKVWIQFDHLMAGEMTRAAPTLNLSAVNVGTEKEEDYNLSMHLLKTELHLLSLRGAETQLQGVESVLVKAHPMPKPVLKRGPYGKTRRDYGED